jgi:hypothetical protein
MISHDKVSYGYRQRATDKSDETAVMTPGAASKEQNAALRVIVYRRKKGSICIFSSHVDTFVDYGFQLQE